MTIDTTDRPKPTRRPLPALGALLLSLAALASCEKDPEIRAEGTADAAVRPEDLVCPKGLPGAELIRVQTKDGVVFCMDQREVTWGEYDTFQAAKQGDVSGQPPECAWNEGYEPEYYVPTDSNYSGAKCEEQYRPTSKGQAANCLDFCDARAYCEWAGKRLCGVLGAKVPEGGVAYAPARAFDAGVPPTEFAYACSQGGASVFPYGSAYIEGRCPHANELSGTDAAAPDIADLAARECRGSTAPFDQLYDLGGSVLEWLNDCHGPEEDGNVCAVGGGAPGWRQPTECEGSVGYFGMKQKNHNVGLRCCVDPEPGRTAAD